MYWDNPIIDTSLISDTDLIASCHASHCLFYDPGVPIDKIQRLISLQESCDLANRWIQNPGSITDHGDIDKILNIVRINQFVHSLRQMGNLKPVLLQYIESDILQAATGGSRLMAAERIAEMRTFPAFISTHEKHRSRFAHLEEITTLAQFARHCGADINTQFYFRFTDDDAPYGIDWYEVSLSSTSVPNNNQCEIWLRSYIQHQSRDFKFTPEWFDQIIDWDIWIH